MSTFKQALGAASQGITVTLAGLTQASARESTAIDNTTNLYLDAIVYLAVVVPAGTPAVQKSVNVWFYGSEDGTNYTTNATGSDAAVTMTTPTNLRGPFSIAVPAGGVTYKAVIPSVAAYFGGVLPPKWGIVVENQTNITLGATEGNFTKEYRGVYATLV